MQPPAAIPQPASRRFRPVTFPAGINQSLLAFAFSLTLNLLAANALAARVTDLTCEHRHDPIGIETNRPRLSWKLDSSAPGERQTAFQIQAADSLSALNSRRCNLWDSGKVTSDQSVLVPWNGRPLASRVEVFWQVRVWDQTGRASDWSKPAHFEIGLLDPPTEWQAQWISSDQPRHDFEQFILSNADWISAGSAANQAAAVRVVLNLPSNAVVRRAAIDATGDGFVTVYVNGQPHSNGHTSRTAPVHADAAAQLIPGRNVIAIGSDAVRTAIRHDRGEAGRNAIAGHVFVDLENGRRIEFDTDHSWKAAVNPNGHWFDTNYDDSSWSAAQALASYSAQPSKYSDNTMGPGRYLRRTFLIKSQVVKARLYATALGVYAASINGRRVSDDLLAPGWTDYHKHVMIQTYDVTRLLSRGTNALGAVLADGWYAGRVGWMGAAQYGTRPFFAAQLEITCADGSQRTIATDDSWKAGSGEIIGSDLQWGEIIDARNGAANWNQPSFDDSQWKAAVVSPSSDTATMHVALVPQIGPPVRARFELKPKKIMCFRHKWIVDFGQNVVGCIRLSAQGAAGTQIVVRHGEMLNPDGSLYTENLRTALATDQFTLGGGSGRETFQPRFTFHGFRYAEISGYPGELNTSDVLGIVVGSDTPETGTWECSDPDLNLLYQNIVWSQRGNFLSVPTDCPQRDERMGWMGDAQVFAPTAARIANVSGFFQQWMLDVNDGQGTNGDFANCSPRVADPRAGWPVWGDAGVIVPWTMFLAYGDPAFLADNYSNMVAWVEFNARRSHDLILNGGVGDHLAPKRTPVDVVDTAYFAHSAEIVSRAAAVLGKTDDAKKYKHLHEEIVNAFNREFVSTNGTIRGDTQTAYILALQFDLLPADLRQTAAEKLASHVEESRHLTTGFVGVGQICPALTSIHRSDLAWRLVLNNSYPSWLFSVKNGATTIWERWDGWTPEHGFQDPSMNSFNHYSFGSVGAWLYSGAAGIQEDPAHPGYKHFFLRPQFSPHLAWLKATQETPYGKIISHWHLEKNEMVYDATVPPNSSATVELPGSPEKILAAGTYHFAFARDPVK